MTIRDFEGEDYSVHVLCIKYRLLNLFEIERYYNETELFR